MGCSCSVLALHFGDEGLWGSEIAGSLLRRWLSCSTYLSKIVRMDRVDDNSWAQMTVQVGFVLTRVLTKLF